MADKNPELELTRLIKRLYTLRNLRVDEALKSYKLARSQFQVLYLVNKAGVVNGRELLTKLQVEPATLSGIVDTLEAKGWLVRIIDVNDKRAKKLRLTAAGKKLLNQIPNPAEAVERQMTRKLTAAEQEKLKVSLKKLTANLENS